MHSGDDLARTGGRRIQLGAPWVSFGSFGRALRSPGSFDHALGVVGYILVRSVRSGAPFGSSGLFGFIRAHLGGHRVHSRPGGR